MGKRQVSAERKRSLQSVGNQTRYARSESVKKNNLEGFLEPVGETRNTDSGLFMFYMIMLMQGTYKPLKLVEPPSGT